MIFAKIKRALLLSTTGWSDPDLSNRTHNNQIGLAFGCPLPAENGVYIGPDVFSLRLEEELVRAGFSWTQAGQLVRENPEKWVRGLERIEWPDLFPKPEALQQAPTPVALAAGIMEIPPDAEIYFGVAQNPDGDFRVACGTMLEIIRDVVTPLATKPLATKPPAGAPTAIMRQVNLRLVYLGTLAAAEKAGVDLGAPFTRPERHPEHREWYAAVEVHRALSFARQKVRKPPGPPPRAKGKQQRAQAPARKFAQTGAARAPKRGVPAAG